MAGDRKGSTRTPGKSAADARAERLAAALRANLLRRKTQAKARADAGEPSDTAADAGKPE